MGRDKYENIRIGMTGRLDTMQAVVLDAKLDIFADELVHRQNAADRYAALLEGVVGTPSLEAGVTSSWAQYVIQLPQGSNRDAICKSLGEFWRPNSDLLSCANASSAALCALSC